MSEERWGKTLPPPWPIIAEGGREGGREGLREGVGGEVEWREGGREGGLTIDVPG